jgi:hypothetical protein
MCHGIFIAVPVLPVLPVLKQRTTGTGTSSCMTVFALFLCIVIVPVNVIPVYWYNGTRVFTIFSVLVQIEEFPFVHVDTSQYLYTIYECARTGTQKGKIYQ